jgi:hypothetical protein
MRQSHPAYGDQHPRFGVPGGENDVPQVVEYIRTLIRLAIYRKAIRGFSV